MLEPGDGANLAQEALGSEGGTELGVEDLQRDRSVVLEIVGEIHPRHPAPAELTLEPVAAGEAGLERGGEAGQATPSQTWRDGVTP